MMKTFTELGLTETILAGVQELGFTEPTPIQEQAIPLVLEGRDLIASAQTGTGKTAAFMLPTMQLISGLKRGKKPLALVVTPTRELAQQIERMSSTIARATGDRIVTIVGGTSYKQQIDKLQKGCDIVVATPGRLIDLMDQNILDVSFVKILVLDEADRMLDMGFWPSVRKIIGKLDKDRQTLLFSATISGDIQNSIPSILKDPATVEIAVSGKTADTVAQYIVPVIQSQKSELLLHLLEDNRDKRVLVFCRTRHRVDSVAKRLSKRGISAGIMHADRQQRQRERALKDFRDGKLTVLAATDVMSRGIDVDEIDLVVNFDVPMDPEDYVHRIGRTGRAGETGLAFTFVGPDEVSRLREIEYFTSQIIPPYEVEGFKFDEGRIVPNPDRSSKKPKRSMYRGSRRGGPLSGGRHGRFR